ncbi:MAG: hypothetical protein HY553_22175 [Elusimicrobia bacterium]|nr:hypothetical protein [Elusimicrobiota bacterium]
MPISRFAPPLALAVACVLPFGAGCGRREPAATAPSPSPRTPAVEPRSYGLPPDFESLPERTKEIFLDLQAAAPANEAQEKLDREELIRPAPPGWKPEEPGRRVRLTLIVKEPTLRRGETLWYRLEFQNTGSESIDYFESDSFFKKGAWLSWGWKFYVNGEEVHLGDLDFNRGAPVAGPFEPPGWEKLTEAERDAYVKRRNKETEAAYRRRTNLSVTLHPGETLVTRPWRNVGREVADRMWARGEDPDRARAPGAFREFYSVFFQFDKPGKYRIKAVYSDQPPGPPTEEKLRWMEERGHSRADQMAEHRKRVAESLGTIESNVIEVEVVP